MLETYLFKIGQFECIAINDGSFTGSAGMLFADAPEDALSAALAKHGEKAESMPSTWTCLLVKTGLQTVLIDTGVGEGNSIGGQLLPSLADVGVPVEAVDTVILTHIHGDHILGCLRRDGRLSFPNAGYVMGKDEWEFWTSESTLAMAPKWAADTARRVLPALSEDMRRVKDGEFVVPGIRILYAPGHTFGHVVVEIMSEGERLLFLADTALHPIHLEYPHWTAQVDQVPERTIQTRLAYCEQASRDEALVLLFHFHPFPSLGRIVKEGDYWSWRSIDG